jgi:hypothetical protein
MAFEDLGRQEVDEEPIGVRQNAFEARLQVLSNANAFLLAGFACEYLRRV